MKVYITTTSIKKVGTTTTQAQDMHLDLPRAVAFSGTGALLAIRDLEDGTTYQTDFAYASAVTALNAAPNAGGFTVLT